MLTARLLRRLLRRLRQQMRYARLSLQGLPILFANSFPKSGTHLLTQVLQAFQEIGPAVDSGLPAVVMYEGDVGRLRSDEEITAELKRFLPGDIGYGHVHSTSLAAMTLSSPPFATYFILRDPRDVAVSHVYYVTELEPRHVHHRYFAQELSSFEERLAATIRGVYDIQPPLPGLALRLAPYLGWLEDASVLTLRYEDFFQDRQTTLRAILEHAVKRGFPLYRSFEEAVQILESHIRPQRSPTFRKGGTGGWREVFTPRHKQLFKEYCAGIVEALGYEEDENW
ncbi:MAG: sulfotransferase domain-containing protein [Anaerolineales bacterium]|nr:sulfotransferase domain-containing protein [Anaerolineales bacterium]MCS7248419.1 sulfotransferase domain-containing protein [Anaerolineales bacterium]MDW8162232.1 sulfotransferase domain-containing protein [Anaerolineales bacterium]MDW8446381.1 sulfotransferase domain-containing protein [Anaerolineales bacterium]